jgi:hypothetical protein
LLSFLLLAITHSSAVQDVLDSLTSFKTEVNGRLDSLTEELRTVKGELRTVNHKVDTVLARQENATKGREERLVPVPKADGTLPVNEFPPTIMHLLVAGNEKLPNNEVNTWNREKSKQLLVEYGEDASDSDVDEKTEYSSKSRARRLRLAKKIGVTQAQLNLAQLTL